MTCVPCTASAGVAQGSAPNSASRSLFSAVLFQHLTLQLPRDINRLQTLAPISPVPRSAILVAMFWTMRCVPGSVLSYTYNRFYKQSI